MSTLIYCFYPATYGNDVDGNALLYNVFDGTSWLGETQVPLTNTSNTPSPIAYDNGIWCFHQGNVNNGELWYNIFDGVEWLGDQHLTSSFMTAGPSTCIYQNKLYCFYPGDIYGTDPNGNALLYNVLNGTIWEGEVQVPATNLSQTPSAIVFRNVLYCFHQGNMNNGQLWYNRFDGTNWLGDTQLNSSVLSSGPSACEYLGKLYCFYPATYGNDVDGNALLYNVFDGENWSGEVQVPATNISKNPAAVVLHGKLYCFHQGNMNNGQLWYNVFDGQNWSGDTQLQSAELSWGPGATTTFRNEITRRLTSVVTEPIPDSPLPIPNDTFFSSTEDSNYNWKEKSNQNGWGFTGVFNWRECETEQGTLKPGSIFIYPGCRLTEDKVDEINLKNGVETIAPYEGLVMINGEPNTAAYRLQGSDPASTLHGQLCKKLMPKDSTEELTSFMKNFLGFAITGPLGEKQARKPKYISHILNSPYFVHANGDRKGQPAERLSPEWIEYLKEAIKAFYPRS